MNQLPLKYRLKQILQRISCWWVDHEGGDDVIEAESPKWGTLVLTYRCPCNQLWERTYFTDDDKIAKWIDGLRQ